jgi:hypothetical protein
VTRLTRTREAGEFNPWKMGDFTAEFIDGMLKAIVGIEFEIARMKGKAVNADPILNTESLGAFFWPYVKHTAKTV